MDQHLTRAQLLIAQSRYEQAAAELRRQLADEPDNALVHALLALCLIERKKYDEATAAAGQAVHLAPDVAFTHYALAKVLYHRNRLNEAREAVTEAISLENQDADYFALLAAIHFDQSRWADALAAADQGLSCDPDHSGCANLRAMSQVKLGRKDQAGATIEAALARDPEDALTHANQGWVLLEKREPLKAAEHFREALRLDPELEWAREGIIEAIKARNPIYRLMLRYFLWMARLPPRTQWLVIIGVFIVARVARSIARNNPDLAPYVIPLLVLYVVFAFMTWLAQPLFDLLLLFNRFGRHALSPERFTASIWLAGCLLCTLAGAALAWITLNPGGLVAALVCAMLAIPLSAVWRCEPGWCRNSMAVYTAALAGVGLFAALPFFLSDELADLVIEASMYALVAFLLGAIAAPWVANLLIHLHPKY
ncbi:MAG: tetratricopeptide repeat protein [Pirellulales bacterium]